MYLSTFSCCLFVLPLSGLVSVSVSVSVSGVWCLCPNLRSWFVLAFFVSHMTPVYANTIRESDWFQLVPWFVRSSTQAAEIRRGILEANSKLMMVRK